MRYKWMIVLVVLICFASFTVKAMSSHPKNVKGDYEVINYNGNNNIQLIKKFNIPQFKNTKRDILVYLPTDYQQSQKRYPVLYMHDAQNLFTIDSANYGGWKVNKTIDELVRKNQSSGAIVVGVYNDGSNRVEEYSPWEYESPYFQVKNPLGDEYIKFIINDLKPYIDQNYRTLAAREHTGIAGSSMGGLISFYAGIKYQSVFSKVGVFSPYFITKKEKIKQAYIDAKEISKKQDMKFYFYVGGQEFGDENYDEKYVEATVEMYELLKRVGFSKEELKLDVDQKAIHNEKYWAKYFSKAFRWLY